MIVLILWEVHQLAKRNGQKSRPWIEKTIITLAIWFAYLSSLTLAGWLENLSMPPRLPLLIFLPFTLYTLIFCIGAARSDWLKSLPWNWLILPQSFRIVVEIILYFTFLENIIPVESTFAGYNYDVLMGISALPMALYIHMTTKPNRRILLAWNIIGILMILFVAFIIGSHFYIPEVWGNTLGAVQFTFVRFPRILVPAFLAPLGIFMHALSIAKIVNTRN